VSQTGFGQIGLFFVLIFGNTQMAFAWRKADKCRFSGEFPAFFDPALDGQAWTANGLLQPDNARSVSVLHAPPCVVELRTDLKFSQLVLARLQIFDKVLPPQTLSNTYSD
jgi:hypothetical protein